MKRLQIFVLVMIVILVFGFNAYSTVTSVGESSEWEATGFNNGRRVVRDSSSVDMGYYHHVWHSQANPRERPSGRDCDIYYACTDDTGRVIFGPVNMTGNLRFIDNRYPSIAIENKGIDSNGKWRLLNNIHLVWQCKTEENYSYDVYHAVIKVNGRTPAPFTHSDLDNLSVTKKNNSLVPAVAINRYYDPSPQSGQNIHVVWQEEEATGPDTESDIYYTRSPDSGKTFTGPQSGGRWDNITNSERNSQMPSISCALDTFQGFPLESGGKDCNYNSKEVHVAYNETIQCNRINVFYLHSLTNGGSWITPQNVSGSSGDPECSYIDMYPSIAADMRDNVHIVFMRRKAHEDDTPRIEYIPGVNPTDNESFPGPDPRMYDSDSDYYNWIEYWSNSPNHPSPPSGEDINKDQEFPTVALDREQNVTVNWQEWNTGNRNYDIIRFQSTNSVAPTRPISTPDYEPWEFYDTGIRISTDDELFPNLAHKKVSMYTDQGKLHGITEIWTAISTFGPVAAAANTIKTFNNLIRDIAVN